MMPLLTALFEAIAAACKAYVARVEWEQTTHKDNLIYELENEKLRLADSGTPADKLRLELISKRLRALE